MDMTILVANRILWHHIRACIAARISELDITNEQPKILEYIACHPGCIQQDICKFYYLEPATVSGSLSRLEKKGFIRKERKTTSSREVHLDLTLAGKNLYNQLEQIFLEIEGTLSKGLSETEYQKLLQYIQDMDYNLTVGEGH